MLEPLEAMAALLVLAGLGALWFRLEQLEERVRRSEERILRLLRDAKSAGAAQTRPERSAAPPADVPPTPERHAPPEPVLSENVFLPDTEPRPAPVRESLRAFIKPAAEPVSEAAPKPPGRELLAVLIAGICSHSRPLRQASLVLLTMTICKVYLFDLWQLGTAIRIFAFTALGAALLLVSFLYRRYHDRIRAWVQDAGEPSSTAHTDVH